MLLQALQSVRVDQHLVAIIPDPNLAYLDPLECVGVNASDFIFAEVEKEVGVVLGEPFGDILVHHVRAIYLRLLEAGTFVRGAGGSGIRKQRARENDEGEI